MSEVLYEERGRVAVLTWNRPDALNTFTHEMRLGIIDALKKCAAADHIRAAVLTGAGRGRAPSLDLAGAIRAKGEIQSGCIDSEDFREGVKAFFEKRAPKFSGR